MAVLVILESNGDPAALMPAADELVRLCGTADGLLLRVRAPADEGMVLVHVWESEEARERFHAQEAVANALEASGWNVVVGEQVLKSYETDRVEIF